MTMPNKKQKPVDPDLATWIRIGEGVPLETEIDEAEGLTPGERIMAAGNAWVREQLQPTIVRTSPLSANPLQRR
jgi:hypothetical protein